MRGPERRPRPAHRSRRPPQWASWGAGPLRVPWGAGVVRPPAVRPVVERDEDRSAANVEPARSTLPNDPFGPAAVQHGHESLLLAHFSRRPALNQTGRRADHHDYRSGTATSVTRRQGPPHRWLPGRAPAELPGRDCPIRAGPPVQVSPGDRVDHLPAESHVAADGNSVKASARGVRLVCGRRRPPAQLGDRWTSERVFTTLPVITPLPPCEEPDQAEGARSSPSCVPQSPPVAATASPATRSAVLPLPGIPVHLIRRRRTPPRANGPLTPRRRTPALLGDGHASARGPEARPSAARISLPPRRTPAYRARQLAPPTHRANRPPSSAHSLHRASQHTQLVSPSPHRPPAERGHLPAGVAGPAIGRPPLMSPRPTSCGDARPSAPCAAPRG